jgi:hypothetical protein
MFESDGYEMHRGSCSLVVDTLVLSLLLVLDLEVV